MSWSHTSERVGKAGATSAMRINGTSPGLDNGILTAPQLKRAGDILDAMSPQERAQVQALLDQAGSEAQRAYILKALAAGHSVAEVSGFATTIRGGSSELSRKP